MQLTNLLPQAIAIFTATPISAAPVDEYNLDTVAHLQSRNLLPTRAIPADSQSCTASQRGCCIAAYGVHIGIPFNNGVRCNDVYDALQALDTLISNWQCKNDGDGMTQLYFNAATGGANVLNDALGRMYPTVNGFNCPNN